MNICLSVLVCVLMLCTFTSAQSSNQPKKPRLTRLWVRILDVVLIASAPDDQYQHENDIALLDDMLEYKPRGDFKIIPIGKFGKDKKFERATDIKGSPHILGPAPTDWEYLQYPVDENNILIYLKPLKEGLIYPDILKKLPGAGLVKDLQPRRPGHPPV